MLSRQVSQKSRREANISHIHVTDPSKFLGKNRNNNVIEKREKREKRDTSKIRILRPSMPQFEEPMETRKC